MFLIVDARVMGLLFFRGSLGPNLQIRGSLSKKDTLIVLQRLRINFSFFSLTKTQAPGFGAQETKAQQPGWLIVNPSNPSPVNLWTLSPWFILGLGGWAPHSSHECCSNAICFMIRLYVKKEGIFPHDVIIRLVGGKESAKVNIMWVRTDSNRPKNVNKQACRKASLVK